MRGSLATIALVILLLSGQSAFADDGACRNLSTASHDDLLAIPAIGMGEGTWSPSAKCSSEGLSAADHVCDEKTTIVTDRMLGRNRRMIVVSYVFSKLPLLYSVHVFGCVAGQVKEVLDYSPGGEEKIEIAQPNKVVVVAPPIAGTNSGGRQVFNWNSRIQRYSMEDDEDSDASPALSKTLPCSKLKSAKSQTLIVLANGDFTDGDGGFPFTHGAGCYKDDPQQDICDWQVDIVEDQMINASRRLIVLNSDHQSGVGSFGYVYVFGCVAGQIRTVLGSDVGYGAGVQKVSADRLTVSTASQGAKDPRCCPTIEELMTYEWKSALQNYVLKSVYYHPSRDR